MGFVRAAKIGDVPPGTIHEFQVEGKAVAVANVAGQFHAINGAFASIAEGHWADADRWRDSL